MRRVGVGLVFRTIGVLRFGVGWELGVRRDLMVVRAKLASGVPQRRAMGRWWVERRMPEDDETRRGYWGSREAG